MKFEWDKKKENINFKKHGISFEQARMAFMDPNRIITKDINHSSESEERFFCFGKTEFGILTVRFTLRDNNIRIFGAGLWRQGKKKYETENSI